MASIRDTNEQREAEGLPPFKSYNLQLADGRALTVDAESEEHAKLLGREQGGNVGVLSVKENTDPDGDAGDTANEPDSSFDPRPESTGLDASPDGIIAETPTDEGAVINDTPADAPVADVPADAGASLDDA